MDSRLDLRRRRAEERLSRVGGSANGMGEGVGALVGASLQVGGAVARVCVVVDSSPGDGDAGVRGAADTGMTAGW